jgi:hypothetical protein
VTEVVFGPYEPDVATVGSGKSAFVRNVFPQNDGYGPMPGLNLTGAALPARCVGFKAGFSVAGSPYVVAGTPSHLYRLDNTSLTWTDVSSAPYSLQPTEFWSFDQFGDNLIAAGGANVDIQTLTLSGSGNFAALAGSPPRARHVSIVGDFVVLSGLTDHPGRIQWSGINDSTWWTPDATKLSDWQDFPDGGVVHGVSGGEYGVVFQDTAIRQMTFAPGSPEIFQFNRISTDRGVLQPLSIARVQTATFFLASDGFYRIDPGASIVPIGNQRVNSTFLADADLTNPLYCVGGSDVASTRIMWAYRSRTASSSRFLDKLLIYDWGIDRWSYGEIGLEFLGSGSLPATTLEGLDAISTSLDLLPQSMDAFIPNQLPTFSAFNDSHQFGFWTGAPLEGVIDTPETTLGNGQRTFIRNIAPIGDAPGVAVSIRTRERLVDAPRQTGEAVLNSIGYCPLRVSGRYHVARVRVPAGQLWSFMHSVDADMAKAGLH